jgi:GTP-binding protein
VQAKFLLSAPDARHFPTPTAPEFAFVGRSNVGKSTLLNALCGARIARVSNTPGRTQLVNFFDVQLPPACRFVDLPGYGFARVPGRIAATFEGLVTAYFEADRPLRAVLLLLDARRQVNGDDRAVLSWLSHQGAEVWPVITKADKLTKAQRIPTQRALASSLGCDPKGLSMTSATRRTGIDELRAQLARSIARSA